MKFWHWHGVHLPQHAGGDFPSQDGKICTCVHMYISLLNEDNKFRKLSYVRNNFQGKYWIFFYYSFIYLLSLP